jgi:ureidoglycolate hydrolase
MNDSGTLPRHMLDLRELTAEAFAPYGEVIAPLRTGGQGAANPHDPETDPGEAELVLTNLENRDTNRRDFHAVPLPAECRYRL